MKTSSGCACSRLCRIFQRLAVPFSQRSAGFVSALQKIEQDGARRAGLADIIVHQKELAQVLGIKSLLRTHRLLRETRRFGYGISVESCVLELASTRPPAGADHFVRVRFTHDLAQYRIG